jgi:retron-type reverse transcriptase|tara:strand:- start:264 stop:1625 length:1362 start_codon:yes stop_codon:yes gene_type:complete
MTHLKKVRFESIYSELALQKSALTLFTKTLFNRGKALSKSHDGKTLFDFAEKSGKNLWQLHRRLISKEFSFQPFIARDFNFNGKQRRIYIATWEDKIVERCLFDLLNRKFDHWMSNNSYAYRYRKRGLDACQHKIAKLFGTSEKPLYLCKRDVRNYFPTIDQSILLQKLKTFIDENDYLFSLIKQRIYFSHISQNETYPVTQGVAFGAPLACFFANVYLTDLDQQMDAIPGLNYFRYADDILFASSKHEVTDLAIDTLDAEIASLKLSLKSKAHLDAGLGLPEQRLSYIPIEKLRYLGLEFRADGSVGLSRDKLRKLRNLVRFSFKGYKRKLDKTDDLNERLEILISCVQRVMTVRIRSVAIIDYYLKHVSDEEQLKELDRWVAEEVLAIALGCGHRKGNFRVVSFKRLRQLGLPSFRHRHRLLRHGHIKSDFFQLRADAINNNRRRRRLPSP